MDEAFPKYILCDTLWDFDGKSSYPSQAAFEQAVFQHHQDAQEYSPEVQPDECWQPESVVLHSPRVTVRYISDPPGKSGVWCEAELASDNGRSFTAGELLFKLHNTVVSELRNNGHHWFEGFELEDISELGIPVYLLRLGS